MSLLDPAQRSARGLALQAEVTGQPPPRPATLLDESWRDFVYAEVWNRPGLDRRSRYLISLASAAMSNGPSADPGRLCARRARGAGNSRWRELREARAAPGGLWRLVARNGAGRSRDHPRRRSARPRAGARSQPIRAEPWDPTVRAVPRARRNFTDVMTFAGRRR